MKPNVGPKERYVRIGVGVLAAVAAMTFSKSKTLSTLLGVVAASGIRTGISRYCMINELLGVDRAPELTEAPIHSLFEHRAVH